MAAKFFLESLTPDKNKRFLLGLGRAFGGALFFSFPVIMTMEMWSLGFSIPPRQLIIYTVFSVFLLTGLSYFVGFKDTENIADDIIDAFAGFAVGFVTAAVLLWIFGIIDSDMSHYEIIGKIILQTIAAGIGAMLAQSQLGDAEDGVAAEADEDGAGQAQTGGRVNYWGELSLMFIGAIFLALNPAATEEVYLIAFKMTGEQVVLLALLSIAMMHIFVYAVRFKGGKKTAGGAELLVMFLRYTIVGYAVALLMSAYLLWTFGTLDGLSLNEALKVTFVLGFPAALGAAASRIIL